MNAANTPFVTRVTRHTPNPNMHREGTEVGSEEVFADREVTRDV